MSIPFDLVRRRQALGGNARRLATRRRDLEIREMEARGAPPLAASPMVSLRAASNGHFYAQVVIGGRHVSMVVDTGATVCSLTEEDAHRVGIRPRASDFTRIFLTQNGSIRVATVYIASIEAGSISMRNVEAVVAKSVPGGESLLGMSFLKRLRNFSMEGGRLTLRG